MGVYLAMVAVKYVASLTITRLVAPGQTAQVILAPILFLATAAIGGCAAARIRRGATMFLALIVMISVAVLIAIQACRIPVPWWYPVGFLTLGPLSVLFTPALFGLAKRTRPRPLTSVG